MKSQKRNWIRRVSWVFALILIVTILLAAIPLIFGDIRIGEKTISASIEKLIPGPNDNLGVPQGFSTNVYAVKQGPPDLVHFGGMTDSQSFLGREVFFRVGSFLYTYRFGKWVADK